MNRVGIVCVTFILAWIPGCVRSGSFHLKGDPATALDISSRVERACTQSLRKEVPVGNSGKKAVVTVGYPRGYESQAERIVEVFGEMYNFIYAETGVAVDTPANPILYVVDHVPASFKFHSRKKNAWVLFCVKPNRLLDPEANRDLVQTLYDDYPHELTHAALLAPRWFEDGLCNYIALQFASRNVPEVAARVLYYHTPEIALDDSSIRDRLWTWRHLTSSKESYLYGTAKEQFDLYRGSLGAFLEFERVGGKGAVRKMLKEAFGQKLREGKKVATAADIDRAARKVFGKSVAELCRMSKKGRIALLRRLLPLLGSSEAEMRMYAAASVAHFGKGDREAGRALLELLNDPEERVRERAVDALSKWGGRTVWFNPHAPASARKRQRRKVGRDLNLIP